MGVYQNDLAYVPHHKMGFKILDEQQLKNLFPNYLSLLDKINVHREKIAELDKIERPKDKQHNLMYDNIFAILGKRGAGKTSVIYTLKSLLKDQGENNIVFPIIMPEMLPKGCSVMGWILSVMEETVDEIDKRLKRKEEYPLFAECLHEPQTSLKQEYNRVKELFYSQFYQGSKEASFSALIINSERQTQNSFDFANKMAEFWDTLKDSVKKAYNFGADKEPLFYLIFDDMDLAPEMVRILLPTIIKYLSHPNLIILITADEELLYDVFECDMNSKLDKYEEIDLYSKVGRLFTNYNEVKSGQSNAMLKKVRQKMEIAQEMPKLYMDKIIPPACRYYLENFQTCEKKSQFIERVQDEDEITLEKFMSQQIELYIEKSGLQKTDNFVQYHGDFLRAYFMFWGDTSRQLANECFILEELVTGLIEMQELYQKENYQKEKYFRDLYDYIYDFAYKTLNVYGKLGMTTEEIKDLLKELLGHSSGEWGIYLHYVALKEFLQKRVEEDTEGKILEISKNTIVLAFLLIFIENILFLETKSKGKFYARQRKKVHGVRELVWILDYLTSGGYSLVCKGPNEDVKEFLWSYEKIFDAPELLTAFKLTEVRSVRNYLYSLPENVDMQTSDLEKYDRENPIWLKSIVQMLYFANEGIYNIEKENILLCEANSQMYLIYDAYYERKLRELKEETIEILSKQNADKCSLFVKQDRNEFMKCCWKPEDENCFNGFHGETLQAYGDEFDKKYENDEKIGIRCFMQTKAGKLYKKDLREKWDKEILYKAMRKIYEELMELYMGFSYYEIDDLDEFELLMQKCEISKEIIQRKNQKYLVHTGTMHRNVKQISEKINEKIDFKDEYWELYERSKKEELNEACRGLVEQLNLAIIGEVTEKQAEKIVKLHSGMRWIMGAYLRACFSLWKSHKEQRINLERIAYKKLYKQIQDKISVSEENEDYLSKLLKLYIREGMEGFVKRLLEVK